LNRFDQLCRRWSLISLSAALLGQPSLRLLLDPLQRISLFLKSKNRIDLAAAPENANGMSLADGVLPHDKLIFRLEVSQFPLLKHRDDIGHFPKLLRNASGHCWGNPERLMDTDEIVVHRVKRNSSSVVLNFL
jgi:hypothetical protein